MISKCDVGDQAPDFDLPTDAGPLRLGDLRGRFVVLFFYPKDDTTGCTAEARDFNRLAPRFAAAGAALVGVSPDSVARHVNFKRKHELDALTLASDPSHATLEAYGVWKEKTLYGRKYMGVERTTAIVDPEGRIARLWRGVKVAGHAEEVLAALVEAQAAFARH